MYAKIVTVASSQYDCIFLIVAVWRSVRYVRNFGISLENRTDGRDVRAGDEPEKVLLNLYCRRVDVYLID